MKNIEIPYEKDRTWRYRIFEIMPGVLSWTMLALPLILSLINVTAACVFILLYLLINVTRAFGANFRALQGYYVLKRHKALPWVELLDELEQGEVASADSHRPQWHIDNLLRQQVQPAVVKPHQLYHAIMIATYNESREVLEPTIQSVLASNHDMQQVMLIIAYEERGGPESEAMVKELISEYGDKFFYAVAHKHPKDIPGEIKGKGGNITFAARELQKYLTEQKIDPINVLVTTLDADNRPDPQYLPALSYVYCASPKPARLSIQPVSMYTNNIWDVPAPMRVIATGNSFYNIVLSLRQHVIRNFSAHAQSMQGLIETDFWSVRTIVEDGHQYWRSYFAFDGDYTVLPLYVPIYQDAVLSKSYVKTLKAQFIQLRRWTYGASDIAYVITMGFFRKNKISRYDLVTKTGRMIEGHVSWAAAPLVSATAGYIPSLVHHDNIASYLLPIIVSRIQTVAIVSIFFLMFIGLKTLPPKPERYKRHRSLFMIIQWAYLPLTTVIYNSFAALYSQTRLMFGKYFGEFDVTDKAVVTQNNETKL